LTQSALLIGSIALGFIAVTSLATFIVVVVAGRDGRRAVHELDRINSRLENAFEQVQHERWEAQQKVRQLEHRLEEQRPQKLMGQLENATKELERLRGKYSEAQRQVGQQEQMLTHQSEQQEQQHLRLEEERQHLMEELGRWRERYVESQQEVKRLEQECWDAQQKVEQLTQLRERLLKEMQEISNE
jgi:chromosome segregation ATPase